VSYENPLRTSKWRRPENDTHQGGGRNLEGEGPSFSLLTEPGGVLRGTIGRKNGGTCNSLEKKGEKTRETRKKKWSGRGQISGLSNGRGREGFYRA